MTSSPPPPPRPSRIDSWQAAEANAAAWMRHWGHTDATVTAGGADGGIDVRASTALAQVKFEAFQVGSPTVQRLVGARGRDHHMALYFFSGAGYARPAIDYANVMDIALFQYALDGSMTAVNDTARTIVADARARRGAATDATFTAMTAATGIAAPSRPSTRRHPVRDLPRASERAAREITDYASRARIHHDAVAANLAGFSRRNALAVIAFGLAVISLVQAVEAVGLSAPAEGTPRAGWGQVAGPLLIAAPLLWVWWRQSRRREQRAAQLRTLPPLGPPPASALSLLEARTDARPLRSHDAASRMAAISDLTAIVPGLDLTGATHVVNALLDYTSGPS